MDLEGKYFVFDFSATYIDGTAFAVMQVENGRLVNKFHPADHKDFGIGESEDDLAIKYLRSQDATKIYSVTHVAESPATFLNCVLWWREELTDPDLAPGQWEFYRYSPIEGKRLQRLQKEGIEAILLDPTPYISSPQPEPEQPSPQLLLPFIPSH